MKVRKLAVALALAGGLGSGVAHALGLGEVELQSYLNEPLSAQIVLRQSRGINPGDVFVNVAPESAYQRVGLDRDLFASNLQFQVVTLSDGSLAVSVSSRERLREPYLHFLLELTWPSGRLLREYAVLVDPPVYAAESGTREPLVAASSGGRSNSSPGANNGAVSRSSAAGSDSALPFASGGDYGPTTSSDTLWSISTGMRPDSSVSVQQVMLAVQDLNPDAFLSDNINLLKRGEVLRAPTLAQIQRLDRGQASQAVKIQNQEFNTTRATIDTSTPDTRATIDASAPDVPLAPAAVTDGDEAELKLVVADNQTPQDANDTEQSGSAGSDGNQAGGGDAGAAVALEELDSARRENIDLNSRVDSLQEQLQTLQRLLELKNNQLAGMQQAGVNGDDENVATNPVVAGESVTAQPAVDDTEDQAGVKPDSAVEVPSQESASPQVTQVDAIDDSEAQGGLINSIMNNPLYQMVLGGGLLLLLLLLLLMSRRKSKKHETADEDEGPEYKSVVEPISSSGSSDLNPDDHEKAALEEESNILAEVDAYLAYGQHERAVSALESAISREPGRMELRLKLLAVYADAQNRVAFERQYGELSALNDADVMIKADRLLTELEQAEAAPSIDDLESELRSGSFTSSFGEAVEETENAKDSTKPASEDSIDYSLSSIKNVSDDKKPAKSEAPADLDDFELSDDFARQPASEDAAALSRSDDVDSLAGKAFDDNELNLNEAFLDELDAELDKDDIETEPRPLNMQESDWDMKEPDLDMLDLENPDDDLELMDEFSDSAGSSNLAIDGEEEGDDLLEMTDAELLALEFGDDPQLEIDAEEDPPTVEPIASQGLDESDLDDDDDFEFLAGTNEAATKLDLAQAYVEMGDINGAREILMEVELEGTAEQKIEANELLKNLP